MDWFTILGSLVGGFVMLRLFGNERENSANRAVNCAALQPPAQRR